MAIVFVSPKKRQKMFFLGITVALLLFLMIFFVSVFFSAPQPQSQTLVFNKPKINVDIGVFNSDQFKNLQPFTEMKTQFVYTAKTKDGKTESGFISANSEEEASSTLAGMGLSVLTLKEVEIGRDNPFIPYNSESGNSAQ